MIILAFFITLAHSLSAELLRLPEILNGKPIYYKKSKQLNSFSCGYNVLFNACNLENFFGITNKFSDYKIFNDSVSYEIARLGRKPKESSSSSVLFDLSKKLNLEKFSYWGLDKSRKLLAFFPHSLRITYSGHISEEQKKELFAREREKQQNKLLDEYITYFSKSGSRAKFIHFCCHVEGEQDHVILISLVGINNKKAIYIFDNLNAPIDYNCQAMRYIEQVCERFKIGGGNGFYQQLPNVWAGAR